MSLFSRNRDALPTPKGAYQGRFSRGYARLSGSDLKGAARKYSGRYHASRANYLRACRASGLVLVYANGQRNASVIIVEPTIPDAAVSALAYCVSIDDASPAVRHAYAAAKAAWLLASVSGFEPEEMALEAAKAALVGWVD